MAKKKIQKQRYRKAEEFDSEFKEKVLCINRCTKAIKGGRKFSFSALIVVGDGLGHIGYGFAKANELTDAIQKAGELARKRIITVNIVGTTIPHEVRIKYDGAALLLKPAKEGTGVIAGSKARVILEVAGYRDIVGKNQGSSNPLNQVHAIFEALESLTTNEQYQQLRGA